MVERFVRGAFYRHDTSGDLDIYVVSVPYFDEKRFKLKVQWISKTTGNLVHFPGQTISGTSDIEIKRSDLQYWSRLK
jgi:hypothetical protein